MDRIRLLRDVEEVAHVAAQVNVLLARHLGDGRGGRGPDPVLAREVAEWVVSHRRLLHEAVVRLEEAAQAGISAIAADRAFSAGDSGFEPQV